MSSGGGVASCRDEVEGLSGGEGKERKKSWRRTTVW